MRLPIIFSLLLALLGSSIKAQMFDVRFPGNSAPYIWADVVATNDGGFVFATSGDNSFIKVDENGEIVWEFNQLYEGSIIRENGKSVIANDDGTLLLAGGLTNEDGYITKVDANGNILWERLIIAEVQALSHGENGEFYFLTGCCLGSLTLVKMNADGLGLWNQYYYRVVRIHGTADGGVLAAGSNNSGEPTILKYDGDGAIEWSYFGPVGPFSNSNSLMAVTKAPNGNVFAVGTVDTNSTDKAFLVELSSSGTVLNETLLEEGSFYQSIEITNDGNLILGGHKARTTKISYNGNVIWTRRTDGLRTQHAISTGDNGSVTLLRDQNGEARLVRTNSDGIAYNTFIGGGIFLDTNDDCLFQNSDSALTATVIAEDVALGYEYYAVSNAMGEYQIDCPFSQYKIKASLSPTNEPCEETVVNMVANIQYFPAGEKMYKFNNNPTSTIRGQVYIDNNGNCVFDAGDEPLECIKVPIAPEGEDSPFFGCTNSTGNFEIEVPGSWHYFLYGTWPGFWSNEISSGCSFPGGYVEAYDTLIMDVPLAPTYINPSYISGYVYIDENLDCTKDPLEIGTDNFQVGILPLGTSDTIMVSPLPDGYFARIVEAGDYEIFVKYDGNTNWSSCDNNLIVTASETCGDILNLGIQAIVPCSDFTVSIATNRFRSCQTSILNVSYQNIGTAESPAEVVVVLDTLLSYTSSSIIPTTINGDTLIFDIADVLPLASGSFSITTELSCDAVLGETHCISAEISGINDCDDVNSSWDESSVQIVGECIDGELNITIENIGDAPMSEELEYIVIEDNILLYTIPFQLNAGEAISFEISSGGNSYSIQADQSTNHPGRSNPSKSFEGCGVNNSGGFSLGYITQYPQDDFDEHISIFCLENVGSYDPNDKTGFPRGVSDQHFIEPNTQMEYLIRFQNTGTAPANTVVIRDEISVNLDISTIRPGAASHNYTYNVTNEVIEFTFPNINLPDSTADLEESQGYVTFIIDQKENNPPGTIITNEAAIFFDNNDPIITNTTVHNIPTPIVYTTDQVELCEGDIYNGILITSDTILVSQAAYAFYINELSIELFANRIYEIEIDTTINEGDEWNGIIYNSPTTIIDSLYSVEGCDSIATVNLDVLSNTIDIENLIRNVTISPNPLSDYCIISDIPDAVVKIKVRNYLGEVIYSEVIGIGSKLEMINMENWVAGMYLFTFETKEKEFAKKVVKL